VERSGWIFQVIGMGDVEKMEWGSGDLHVVETFTSKKNRVHRVTGIQTGGSAFGVLKEFADARTADKEAGILRMLHGTVAVPAALGQEGSCLLLEYIPGITLADWLEKAEADEPQRITAAVRHRLVQLIDWLQGFYTCLEADMGQTMIMGDVNLRNFVVGDTITGIDFEDVRAGQKKEDLGTIAAFILMYAPEQTPWKQELVDIWLNMAGAAFSLERNELADEMTRALQDMAMRRARKNG
jgi:hypothetical protein